MRLSGHTMRTVTVIRSAALRRVRTTVAELGGDAERYAELVPTTAFVAMLQYAAIKLDCPDFGISDISYRRRGRLRRRTKRCVVECHIDVVHSQVLTFCRARMCSRTHDFVRPLGIDDELTVAGERGRYGRGFCFSIEPRTR